MTKDQTVSTLADIIRTEIGDASIEITPETMFVDIPGWDSVTMAGSVLSAEDRFGVQLRIAELDRLEHVGELADLVIASGPAAN